jgi:hypothetical protein
MWERLPLDVINIILSYDGSIIKERNGKYMTQIKKTDERYEKLLKIPLKEIFSSGPHVEVYFLRFAQENNNRFMFTLTMADFYDCSRFVMYKNGAPIDETRFIIR